MWTTLVADLDERGLLDEVLVIAMGEFGRTPVMGTQAAIDAPQIASIASFALLILMLTLAPEGIAPWAGRLFTARGSGGDGDDSGTDAGTRFGPDKARNPLTSLIGRERQGSQKSSFLIRR